LGNFVICGVKFTLTEDQYKFLVGAQRREKVSKRYKKITVILMLHQGHSIVSIEQALGIDDNTVRRYYKRYEEKGFERFVSDNYLRYKGKLTSDQEELLAAHLEDNYYADAKMICEYVIQEFNVNYSVSGMTKLLHRIGFVYKKTKAVPSKADEAAQVEFLEETLPSLLEEVDQGQAVIYYADGCHPTHNTNNGKGWIKKGQDFKISCNSGRDRVNINAAINAMKPEHMVYELPESVNAQSTKRLCQMLMKKHRHKKIYLICDNARYYRNRWLKDWIEEQRVELIYLPAYSPNLNLIERLWRFMRKKVINCYYYDNLEKFRESIEEFMNNGKNWKAELRSLMTMNFQTIGGCSVHSK